MGLLSGFSKLLQVILAWCVSVASRFKKTWYLAGSDILLYADGRNMSPLNSLSKYYYHTICKYTYNIFRDVTSGWRTVLAISKEVKEPANADYLIRHVLSKHDPPKYDEDNLTQLALIGLGALTKTADKCVAVPSPLIRQIIMTSLAKASKPELDSFAVTALGGLDVPNLMRYTKTNMQ
jgi:hypothetical protein